MENPKLYLTSLKNNVASIKFYGCSEGGDVTSGSRVKLKRGSTMNDRKIFLYGEINSNISSEGRHWLL